MNRIQRLFEMIAGVSQAERQRWERAQAIFGAPPADMFDLTLPACWRRKANVQGIKR